MILFLLDSKDFPTDEEHEKGVTETNLVYRVNCTVDPPELVLREDLSGRILSEKFMDNSQVGLAYFVIIPLHRVFSRSQLRQLLTAGENRPAGGECYF